MYKKSLTEKEKKDHIKKKQEAEQKAYEMVKKVATEFHEDPEKIADYFKFASQFYTYSFNNVTLIYAQNPHASFVQSFKAWKDMGSSVLAGATGLKVWVPKEVTFIDVPEGHIKLSEASKDQKELVKEGQLQVTKEIRFGLGSVFDISQTNFPKERYPEIYNMGYNSVKHKAVLDGLIKFAEKELNCPVSEEKIDSISLLGFYSPAKNEICLNDKMEDTMKLSTMSHELGHALIHSKNPESSTAQKEFEGDAVSIMIQTKYGIELTDERKRHIATHFQKFKTECSQAISNQGMENGKSAQEEDIIRASFKNVFNIYKGFSDKIDEYVNIEKEKALPEKLRLKLLHGGVNEEYLKKGIESGKIKIQDDNTLLVDVDGNSFTVLGNPYIVTDQIDKEPLLFIGEDPEDVIATENRIEALARISQNQSVAFVTDSEELKTSRDSIKRIAYGRTQAKEKDIRKKISIRQHAVQIEID